MHDFDLLAEAQVPGLRAELRLYRQVRPYEITVQAPTNIVGLNLGSTESVWSRRIAAKSTEFHRSTPLSYRSRHSEWEFRSGGDPAYNVVAFLNDQRLDDRPYDGDEPAIHDRGTMEIMKMIGMEINSPGFASEAMIGALRDVLILKMLGWTVEHSEPDLELNALTKEEINRIRDYIWASSQKPPTVEDLADLCAMSTRTLLRRFKAATNQAPSAFIADVQFAKAQALLENSQLSLKEIAYDVGFATPSQFSRAFKRLGGVTPSQYRQRRRHH